MLRTLHAHRFALLRRSASPRRALALALSVVGILLLTNSGVEAGSNNRGFGAGIMAGEPTGISLKVWSGQANAFDAGIGWSFSDNSSVHIHGDYLWHNFSLINVEKGQLPLYFGIGARLRFVENRDDDIGVRVPVGLNYLFEDSPVDLFVEVVPILDLTPDTDLNFNAALGGRFFF